MQDNQNYGACTLYNYSDDKKPRWVLHIPIAIYRRANLEPGGEEDRGIEDVIARILGASYGKKISYPLWAELCKEYYAVEFPPSVDDAVINRFVQILTANLLPELKPPLFHTPQPATTPPTPPKHQTKKTWWLWLRRIVLGF